MKIHRNIASIFTTCLITLLILALPACSAPPIRLVANGQADAVIVIADDAGKVAREAADVLQRTLHEMSGATLAIHSASQFEKSFDADQPAVLVGMSRAVRQANIEIAQEHDGNDHYVMRTIGNRLALAGNDAGHHRGTAYAVYDLLDRLGCGWYAPGELWQVIPKKKTITVAPLNVSERPAFEMRHIWMVGTITGYDLRDAWRLGGRSIAHGHAMEHLVPRNKFGKTHPQFYSSPRGQPCFSHPGVIKVIVDECRRRLDKQSAGIVTVSLCASDNPLIGSCPDAPDMGNASAHNLYLANAVARELAKTHPGRFLLTFYAYWVTHPPPDSLMKAEPGVVVMLVNEGDHLRSWADPDTPNRPVAIGKTNQRERKHFLAWKKTGAVMAIYDYFIPGVMDHTWQNFQWNAGDTTLRNLRYWQKHNVRFISYESQKRYELKDGGGFPLRWPLMYVAARGMWDTKVTSAQVMREACSKLYGPAAEHMYHYYRGFEDAAAQSDDFGVNWNIPGPDRLYTPAIEAAATRHLDAAAASTNDEAISARIAEEQRLWQRARTVLAQLRKGNVAGTHRVSLDQRTRNYSRSKLHVSSLRWLHGLLEETPIYVVDPDGKKRPVLGHERFDLPSEIRFTTVP